MRAFSVEPHFARLACFDAVFSGFMRETRVNQHSVLIFRLRLVRAFVAPFLALAVASLAHGAPACWPSTIGGTGTKAVVGVTANGGFVGWWCWTGTEWKADYVLSLPGFVLKHPEPVPADAIKAAEAYWTLWSQPSTPAFDPLRSDMWAVVNAAKPAAPPPPPPASAPPEPVWKVALNGTYTTRPAYRVVNGALVADGQRATVGNVCACTLKFVQGTSTYCQPAPLVGVVALCRVS